MQAGSRCYFTCGSVTLQVVDVSSAGKPHPAAKALYFVVKDLDAIFARAKSLRLPVGGGCARGAVVVGEAFANSGCATDKEPLNEISWRR